MAIKKITLNEDHLKLISAIRFEAFDFDEKESFSKLKKMARQLKLVDDVDLEQVSDLEKDRIKVLKEVNDDILNDINNLNPHEHIGWCIDKYNLFGGTYVLEDVALIIGKWGDFIPGTEYEPTGRRYSPEDEEYMYGLYEYIVDNMVFIESLVHTYAVKGGLTAGTYKCVDYQLDWEKVN